MKKLFNFFFLLTINLVIYSQSLTLPDFKVGLQYIPTLISKDTFFNLLLDSVIEESKDCLLIKEKRPYCFHIYQNDSVSYRIKLSQYKSFNDFRIQYELYQEFGSRFCGIVYRNALFITTQYNNDLFDIDTSKILQLEEYFTNFQEFEKNIVSYSYKNDSDEDFKNIFIKLIKNNFIIEYSSPCIQNWEEIPLMPIDAIECTIYGDSSTYLRIFSPYTDSVLRLDCTVLINFDSNINLEVDSVIDIYSIDVSKMVYIDNKFHHYSSILFISKNLYYELDKFEQEQIEYYTNQIVKLLNSRKCYIRNNKYINHEIGKIQPVRIALAILPMF